MPFADAIVTQNQASFGHVLPELVIAGTALLLFLLEVLLRGVRHRRAVHTAVTFAAVLLALGLLLTTRTAPAGSLFAGLLVHDAFAWYFRALALVTTAIVLVMAHVYDDLPTSRLGSFYGLLLTIVLGLLLLPGATDLLLIVLALELVSLPSYALTGYRKGCRPSAGAR